MPSPVTSLLTRSGRPVTVIRSRRKSLSLEIGRDLTIVLRAPQRVAKRHLEQFVAARHEWIEKHLSLMSERPPVMARPGFEEGAQHWLLGRRYPLVRLEGRKQIVVAENQLQMRMPDNSSDAECQAYLEKFYRQQAASLFAERLALYLSHPDWAGAEADLKIRKMKSRWGSCSSRGVITLNLHLIQADLALIDYVVCHEIAHLKVMNHSASYYHWLSKLMPDWAERRTRLNHFFANRVL